MYVRTINNQDLNFCVSGKLWNRSLVMLDVETESLWSHILGECMEGKLKGTELKTLPADMLTWSAWKAEHPKTTVLNMRRTNRNYTKDFYRDLEKHVLGFTGKYGMQHVSFASLNQQPVANIDAKGEPLLALFDKQSTSARLFNRKVGDQTLTFKLGEQGDVVDTQTSSTWNRSGVAIAGTLRASACRHTSAFRRSLGRGDSSIPTVWKPSSLSRNGISALAYACDERGKLPRKFGLDKTMEDKKMFRSRPNHFCLPFFCHPSFCPSALPSQTVVLGGQAY